MPSAESHLILEVLDALPDNIAILIIEHDMDVVFRFAKQVTVAERQLERNGPWLLGELFTGADILLASCLGWALFYEQPLSETLRTYLRCASERDAYRHAYALNFPPEVMARLRGESAPNAVS